MKDNAKYPITDIFKVQNLQGGGGGRLVKYGSEYKLYHINHEYKYFMVPEFGFYYVFFINTRTEEITKLLFNVYYPVDFVQDLFIVNPIDSPFSGWSDIWMQIGYCDIQKNIDFSNQVNGDFVVNPETPQLINLSFPTYNLKTLFIWDTKPSSYDIDIRIHPYDNYPDETYLLESETGASARIINNIYRKDKAISTELDTSPNLSLPSWNTVVEINNNGVSEHALYYYIRSY